MILENERGFTYTFNNSDGVAYSQYSYQITPSRDDFVGRAVTIRSHLGALRGLVRSIEYFDDGSVKSIEFYKE